MSTRRAASRKETRQAFQQTSRKGSSALMGPIRNYLNRLKFYGYRRGIKLYEQLFYRKLHYFPPLPFIVNVELTNHCNARCTMCDRPTMTRPTGYIEWGLYRHVIDQAASFGIRRVNLNRFGEPLLHPEVASMVRYAKEKGIKEVSFVTNGMLLDERKASAIIDAGLDKITISIDGATADTFEKIRVGCKYPKVTENVERFLELRGRKGVAKPYVQISTLLMQDTLHELDRVIERWRPLVDEIRLGPALQYGNVALNPLVPRSGLSRKPYPCSELFWRLIIFWNGDTTVCCEDINGALVVGNVRESSIRELWNSEKIRRIRRLHLKKEFSALPVCEACDLSNENMVDFLDRQTAYYSKKYKLHLNVQ